MHKTGFTPEPEENKTKYCVDCIHAKIYPDHKTRPKHQLMCMRPIENLVTRDIIQSFTDCNSERTAIPDEKDTSESCGKEAKFYISKENKKCQ